MIDNSPKKKKEMQRWGLSAQKMAFADLILSGWSETDAFVAMGWYKPLNSDAANLDAMKGIIETRSFQVYLYAKRKAAERAASRIKKEKELADETAAMAEDMVQEKESAPLSKEALLAQLLEAAELVKKEDPKKYADILSKYADLQKMKQEEVKTEDTTVHYYLPLTCSKCSLYVEAKKRKKG